jgi:hypothetical protein
VGFVFINFVLHLKRTSKTQIALFKAGLFYLVFLLFQPNPVYSYSYQVADDDQQTYMAKTEERDGDQVTGEYSYVDANGDLVTVKYEAGIMGYTETRSVTKNFVTIRARPQSTRIETVETVQSNNGGGGGSSQFSSGNQGWD